MENEPLFIVLVDDDEADRLLFMEIFSELKIKTRVETFNNGVELMSFLYTKEVQLPDLIFLDLNMPLKDGLQCLREIRQNETLITITVAIYSTSNSQKDIEETFCHGANIYITKPSDFNILKIVLEKAVVTTYHYEQAGLRRENFVLKI